MQPRLSAQNVRTNLLLIATGLAALCATKVGAQDPAVSTNAPKTHLESFARQTGIVLIRGVGEIGSVNVERGVVTVTGVEYVAPKTGDRARGLNIRVKTGESLFHAFVDDDEIEPLLAALNAITKVEKKAVSLPSFEAYYRTRDELRLATFNTINGPTEDMYARISMPGCFNLTLTVDQLSQLRALIAQAKATLDSSPKK